ncbi:MAG: glycine/sarcosine/betaine reductase component B subunit, partial [Desulfatiglandales bacterium]|nr:glycine/sarcosine/betaine reductase component B subunit [Desulfatiglandales bacterium]
MRLELEILNIKDIQFADRTEVDDGVLNINPRELKEFLQKDNRLSNVDIELARPGEKCRILRVHDVIEPRAKSNGSGEDFPGALGRQGIAGKGGTCVLRGAAVVLSECHENGHNATRDDPNGEIIDMSGPAAEIGIYGNTHNIVLLPHPAGRARLQDYRKALKIAGLKTATYLARAGHGLNPDEVEVYDLSPVAKTVKGLEDLPRVAYIFQILSMQFAPIPGDPVLYGSNVDGIVPTVLHPNEVLDGAVCNPCRGNLLVETYVIQNQPIIKELYRRHGRDLNFAGVIIATAHNNPPEYERTAYMAAHLSKWVLGADGVIVTKAGGGAPEVSMSQIALRCEEIGVNSAIAMAHMAADANDTSSEASVI